MLLAIPSKGRAGRVKSLAVLPAATLFVPAGEVNEYTQARYPHIVGVPDEVRGITATRNWILRSTDDKRVVFIDDDVKNAGWRELLPESSISHKLTQPEWLREFAKLFDLTEELRLRVWGVSTDGATWSIYPYRPFIFHTYVTASCMGMVNNGELYFDESYPVKEDYELCLRCLRDDGAVLGARYLYWYNDHWTGEGGCKSYRTQAMENQVIRKLIKTYPGLIRRVTRGGSSYSIGLNF